MNDFTVATTKRANDRQPSPSKTDKARAPIATEASTTWQAIAHEARVFAEALVDSAAEREYESSNTEAFWRLTDMASTMLGQLSIDEQAAMNYVEGCFYNSMALIKGALGLPDETPDAQSKTLLHLAFGILNKATFCFSIEGAPQAVDVEAFKGAVAAAEGIDLPAQEDDAERADFLNEDRRDIIRVSVCEILDWTDLVITHYGESDFERVAPVILRRANLLAGCILDAVGDEFVENDEIRSRMEGNLLGGTSPRVQA